MYGYGNCYGQPRNIGVPNQQYQQPIQQPVQQIAPIQNSLQGKVVDSIEVVKAMDIPFDGSVSYFALADGTAIVTKSLQMDGTSKIVVYKPIGEDKKELPKYLTIDDLKEELKNINSIDQDDFDDLKEDIESLKKDVKNLKVKKSKDE